MNSFRSTPPAQDARSLFDRIDAALAANGLAANGLSASAQVGLELGPEAPELHITRWYYTQRLHELWHLQIEASSAQPLADADRLLWQTAVFWQRDGVAGFHRLTGRVQAIGAAGASADLWHYRFSIVPPLAVLGQTRRERVFQRCTALDVTQGVLAEHGIHPVEVRDLPALARWRHLSQHRDPAAPHRFESDLHFVRRVLAEEGLTLWFEPDAAGERIVIGRAGICAQPARPQPLVFATPAGLNAPADLAEHLLDVDLRARTTPDIARVWAYNYRDAGSALRAEAPVDPQAPRDPGGSAVVWEEPRYGTDALIHAAAQAEVPADNREPNNREPNHHEGVAQWLQAQANLLAQRHRQQRQTLSASSNAAGLWRCGQTVQLGLPDASLDCLWLLTRITAGSHIGPWLEALPGDPASEPGPSQAHVHFEASPLALWVGQGWAPEPLMTAPLDLEHARIGATPGSTYAYLDTHGRYQLEMNADQNRAGQPHASAPPGGTSRPARHIRSHAGADHGWHLPLHQGTEALVAFHAGHPDTPMIAGALHQSTQPDHVTGSNASRNVLRTWANNKFRLEDREGEEHIKLGTEHGLSQLNLGHHVDAERVARGAGLELRTDHRGALRASKGLLVTTFAGQPRGAIGGLGALGAASAGMSRQADGSGQTLAAFGPAHQLHNPGHADAAGAQAMAEQRSSANEQVDLGTLDALPETRRLIDRTADFGSPLLHYASAAHLMQLTPASQQFAAHAMSVQAQGSVELASADQIRLYARQGITWHTEGADAAGAGPGGARADIISQGNDETQVFEGAHHLLAEQDIVMEFRGARALFAAAGASLELTQDGQLNITANQEIVSEAGGHLLGGALDWASGSGSVSGTSIGPRAKVEDRAVARFRIGALPGMTHNPYANEPYKVFRNGVLHAQGLSDGSGAIVVPHLDGTSRYRVELATGQSFDLASSDSLASDHPTVEQQVTSAWGHRTIDGLEHLPQGGRELFDLT